MNSAPPRPAGLRQGHPGEADRRRVRHPAHRDRATCSAPRSRPAPSSAGACSRSSTRGELVPDELTIALIRERLAEDDAARRLRARRLPAQPAPRRRRSTRCSREIGRALDAVLVLRSADEVARERLLGARATRRAAPTTRPRRSRGGSRSTTSETAPLVEHYRARGQARRASTPTGRSTRSSPRSRTRSSRWRRARDHPQGAARDRADGRAPARLVAETIDARRRAPRARASRRASSTASPRSFIRSHGGVPTSKGYKGYPRRDLHLAERDGRPRHPRAATARGGRHRHVRRRRHARRR